MKPQEYLILGLLLTVAGLLFTYNLTWGSPFYFNPDERNIAYSVNNIIFPSQLNPHFFAYGSLPIYTIYIAALLIHGISHISFFVSIEEAIIASRIISSILALATIILTFHIGKKLHSTTSGLLASFFCTFSIGFIQYAHFGTFEMWLSFFYLLLFYAFIVLFKNKSLKNYFFLLLIVGILISVKISSLSLLIIPLVASIAIIKEHKERILMRALHLFFLSIAVIGVMFLITNPFVLFDSNSFISSIRYESAVATGALPVFYSGGFNKTIPIIYQFTQVFPFLLNPILFCVGILSLVMNASKKNPSLFYYKILILFLLLYFFSQALLFVKWTRYMVPTIPFFYLSISFFLVDIQKRYKDTILKKALWKGTLILSILSSIIWSSSYVVTVYNHPDTRISALTWATKHIPQDSRMLTEAYDLGTLPFTNSFPNINIFNFYELETNAQAKDNLEGILKKSEFLILPSQRILKTRLSSPISFPAGNAFYATLDTSKVFEKVYETPCDIYCLITYGGDPIFRYEETSSVFDRPTVIIYRINEK